MKQGCIVDVVYLYPGTHQLSDYPINFICLGGEKERRFIDLIAYRKLSQIIKKGRYDIVQANASDTLKYAVLSKLLFSWTAKIVYRNASMIGMYLKGAAKTKFNSWLLNKCDYIISVSEMCRLDLVKICPQAEGKSCTISTGSFDYSNVQVTTSPVTSRPLIITIGSLVFEKNHLFILKVFHKFRSENGVGTLWVVGDGKLRENIENAVATLQLTDSVKFWGYTKNVIPMLKAADIMLIPSVLEGMPGVILEAMSSEVPVVASDVGGIPEIISHDINGISIAGWSEETYVQYMNRLLSDHSYRQRLVSESRKRFLDKYTMEKIAMAFKKQFELIINEKV
jgi:glycosyltransferase involved in cell wall biosynthesis